MNIFITSGGTRIPIDPVRSITNMSTGRFGSEIAKEFLRRNHDVLYLGSKHGDHPFKFVSDSNTYEYEHERWLNHLDFIKDHKDQLDLVKYDTFQEYHDYVETFSRMYNADISIMVAAVSDYDTHYHNSKINSSEAQELYLTSLPKVIKFIKNNSVGNNPFLIGFKLESYDKLPHAMGMSVMNNGCDMVVGNDIADIKRGDHRLLVMVKNEGLISIPYSSDYVQKLVDLILEKQSGRQIRENVN